MKYDKMDQIFVNKRRHSHTMTRKSTHFFAKQILIVKFEYVINFIFYYSHEIMFIVKNIDL